MFILANNKTHDVLKVSGQYIGLTEAQQLSLRTNVLNKAVAEGYLLADLEYFYIEDSDLPNSTCQRILAGASYDVIWTGGNITSIDFSPEDAKGYVKFTSDKTEIRGDGVDSALITLTVYLADKVTVKNINAVKLVPIKIPGAIISARMQLVNGIGTLTFKKINDLPLGNYTFPVPSTYLFGFKVWQGVSIDVYLQM